MDNPWQSLHNLATWHVRSVERARVNALVASTALVGRRRERDEAEEFLEWYLSGRAAAKDPRSA